MNRCSLHPAVKQLSQHYREASLWNGASIRYLDPANSSSVTSPASKVAATVGPGLWAVKLSHDQRLLATAQEDNAVQLWEMEADCPNYFRLPKFPLANLKGHLRHSKEVEFLSDGKTLASVSRDQRINFWNIERDRKALRFGSISPTAVDFDDNKLLVGNYAEVVCWDNSKREICFRIQAAEARMILTAEFFRDRELNRAFALDGQGLVRVFDVPSGGIVNQFSLPGNSRLKVNQANQEFVAALNDGRLQRIGFDGAILADIGRHKERVNRIAVSKSGKFITCSTDGTVKTWDESFQHVDTDHVDCFPSALAFSESKDCIAIGGANSSVHILSTSGDEPIILDGHFEAVTTLDFSPDGTRLASGGVDQRIALWETENWNEVFTFDQFGNKVNCLKFSPDNQVLIAGTDENLIWLLEAPGNQRPQTFGR